MKHFGTVQSFNSDSRIGSIKPEKGGDPLGFEGSAVKWANNASPTTDQRLSYDLGTNSQGRPCALNLQTI